MSDTKDLTPEEEVKAQEAPKEEEIRENIISEYGFDETDDADRIDKLVAKEVDNAKKLSSAIGQKIKHRKEAEDFKEQLDKKPPVDESKKDKIEPEDLNKAVDDKVAEQLEQREIDSLDYSDELKEEIKRVAKIQDKSIKEVLRDPYIASKVEEYKKEKETEEATITRKNNTNSSKDYSIEKPPVVDMNTEEGRKEWDDYTKAMIEKGH